MLKDDNFIKTNLTDDMPERTVLYEDPEFVFCILGHVYHDAKGSNPHSSGRRNESVPVARALTPSETVSGSGDNPAAPGYATRS